MSHDTAKLHGHDAAGHPAPVTLKGYLTGFLLSVFLTVVPFWLVMGDVLGSNAATAVVIFGFAAVQIVVQMVFFLHMDPRSEGGWNMMALIFTLILVVITLAGSLWIMHHLNTNMMPGMHEMGDAP